MKSGVELSLLEQGTRTVEKFSNFIHIISVWQSTKVVLEIWIVVWRRVVIQVVVQMEDERADGRKVV